MYAVSDIHGHLEKLTAALHAAGLTDAEGNWTGDEDVRLWFLGDFFDRGPDGIGVLRWSAAGRRRRGRTARSGCCSATTRSWRSGCASSATRSSRTTASRSRSFERSWALNGGQDRDQELLTDDDVAWLLDQPMLGLDADHLLMHSDTEEYLEWGDSIDEINASRPGRAAQRRHHRLVGDLAPDDVAVRVPRRDRPGGGPDLLQHLGGRRIVHGHSIVADQLGIDPQFLTGPLLYADGLALGIDGGAFDGGPCLVVELTAE